MKVFSSLLVILALKTSIQGKPKLVGKYKFVPNHGKVYFIDFNDSVYTKKFSTGETNRGVVEYGGNYIYLRDYEKELKEIDSRLIYVESKTLKKQDLIALKVGKKKSMDYCHHAYNEGDPINWLDVCLESGKLVKTN